MDALWIMIINMNYMINLHFWNWKWQCFDREQQQYNKYLMCIVCEKYMLDINLNIILYLKRMSSRNADPLIIILSGWAALRSYIHSHFEMFHHIKTLIFNFQIIKMFLCHSFDIFYIDIDIFTSGWVSSTYVNIIYYSTVI